MKAFKFSWHPRLIPAALGAVVVLALFEIATLAINSRVYYAVEAAADRVHDVAMPTVFESTRQARALDRLARGGRLILMMDDIRQRQELRSELESIAIDGALGTEALHVDVTEAFTLLDANLALLQRKGMSARAEALAAWTPHEVALISAADALSAETTRVVGEEVDGVIDATDAARHRRLISVATLWVLLMCGLAAFLILVARPIVRLTHALKLAREGYRLQPGHERLHEMRLLDDAAVALADAHQQLEQTRHALEQQAYIDPLTGLHNRAGLVSAMEAELLRCHRYGKPVTVISLHLDQFAALGQRHGREGADAALVAISRHLRQIVRAIDLAGRYSDEQFVLIMPETTLDVGAQAGARLREELGELGELAITMPDNSSYQACITIAMTEVATGDTDLGAILRRM